MRTLIFNFSAIAVLYYIIIFSYAFNIPSDDPGNPRKKIKVETNIFIIIYDEIKEQPLSIEYKVKCSKSNNSFSRENLQFYTNDSIHTSDHLDYQNNDFDKGHMVPAANVSCNKEELVQTFSYLNCALQHKHLNRGVWKSLEVHERKLAENTNVTVKIKVHFSKNSVKLSTGATVPDGFTKTLYYSNKKEVYYFPNSKPLYSNFYQYRKN